MYKRGGLYLDAEDVPLVRLQALLRPCDTLVLARDWCPELWRGGGAQLTWRNKWGACNQTSVQISFMAAAPGHSFFHCALQRAVRNVETGYYGPGDLFVTGPPLAGSCLDQLHRGMEYTMEIAQGKAGLFVGDTPVIRTHAWHRADAPRTNTSRLSSYAHFWRTRRILKRRCSVRRGRLVDN